MSGDDKWNGLIFGIEKFNNGVLNSKSEKFRPTPKFSDHYLPKYSHFYTVEIAARRSTQLSNFRNWKI
jgi:hypothetical protein